MRSVGQKDHASSNVGDRLERGDTRLRWPPGSSDKTIRA